jgi:hypothetical protein
LPDKAPGRMKENRKEQYRGEDGQFAGDRATVPRLKTNQERQQYLQRG